MHSKTCLANALISAVENLRDDTAMTSFDFRIAAQENKLLALADSYLEDFSPSWDICRCGENTLQYLFEFAKGDVSEAQRKAERLLQDGTLSPEQYMRLARMCHDYQYEPSFNETGWTGR